MIIEVVPHSGMVVVSEVRGDYLETRKYLGCSQEEAEEMFREEFPEE